jgi:THO complex subunit 5
LLVGLITTSNSEVQIKENVDAIGYYQVHSLTVIVHVYDDELTSGTKPSKLVTLKFEYLLKLHVVCVGVDGMQGGSENNFLINLFPDNTGIELPHQIAKLSSGLNFAYDEKRAQRPFKWVQHLAGIDFLPEAPPFLADNISGIDEAAKGASTLAGLNIYRQLHLCTVFVEYHLAVTYWHLGLALATGSMALQISVTIHFILLLHM